MKDTLPSVQQYREYLSKCQKKFKLDIDTCRSKFGLYTIQQFEELLKEQV